MNIAAAAPVEPSHGRSRLLLPVYPATQPPKCWATGLAAWKLWLESAEATRMSPPSPCIDCRASFARLMRRRGLCSNLSWSPPIIEIDPPMRRGDGVCALDGLTFDGDHPQCRRCEILTGPRHSNVDLVDGLCERCRR